MGLLLYPGRQCEVTEGTPPTLDCVRIATNAFTATITNATRAYWVQSGDPSTQHEIPLVSGGAVYTVTIYLGATYTVCAEGGVCGTCSGGTVCCSFECAATDELCSEACCVENYPEETDAYCQSILAPDGNVYDACVVNNVLVHIYYEADECETGITDITPMACTCWSTELGASVTVQFIQFEVSGTGAGTFDPYIPPDDSAIGCDVADCPDFDGTYIVPCDGTSGPFGGLDLLCTSDIGGTNYDWYIYKWWLMEDGKLYLRMGLLGRESAGGGAAPTPINTTDDWTGTDIYFQQRLEDRYYEWVREPIEITDTCTGAEFNHNDCSELGVSETILIDPDLCNDPTVTISELIYA